jgi:hypothetical protein
MFSNLLKKGGGMILRLLKGRGVAFRKETGYHPASSRRTTSNGYNTEQNL